MSSRRPSVHLLFSHPSLLQADVNDLKSLLSIVYGNRGLVLKIRLFGLLKYWDFLRCPLGLSTLHPPRNPRDRTLRPCKPRRRRSRYPYFHNIFSLDNKTNTGELEDVSKRIRDNSLTFTRHEIQ